MNPQDDPEARIRSLEPTELGSENARPSTHGSGYGTPLPPPLPPPTQQWPDQTPYPPPAYGQQPYGQPPYDQNPYGAQPYTTGYAQPYPTGPSGTGFRPWMAIVPLLLICFLFAGGAAAYFVFSSSPTPGTPGIAGGGDVLTNRPETPALPALPTIVIPTDTVAPPSDPTPDPGTTVTINGIGANKTVTCNDNIIIIAGANNTINITGHCTAITVSGFENVVTAESTQEIAVSGFDNKITYRTGEPQVSESGSGNSITQG